MKTESTSRANGLSSGTAYRSYVLGLLCLVYMSNHIDRQILMILLQPIKDELGTSDLEMGLLTGPAFALFYTFAGIPIARWADRGSRKTIIAISALIWSAMTTLSGTARSFASLALMRVGVGIGEAGCSPPSHSLISDYFPPHQRARALGIYSAGTQLGAAIGWLLGGWLAHLLGWRDAFIAVGVPGVALALLVAVSVREPERGASEIVRDPVPVAERVPRVQQPLGEALRELWQKKSFVWLQVGGALHAVAGYGVAVWVAPFLMRVHDLEIQVIGTSLGFIALAAGLPGMFIGGYLCDRLVRRDVRWYLWVPTLAALVGIPFTTAFLFLPSTRWALAAYAVHSALNLAFTAPVYALMQALVRVESRALAAAVFLFVTNLVGLGVGPVVVGALNDALHPSMGVESIRYTMLVAAITNVIACVFYLRSARTVADEMENPIDGGVA
ncbi:MAG: MFS transporter [bacterium]|nr:MFS transporter [bacterium]